MEEGEEGGSIVGDEELGEEEEADNLDEEVEEEDKEDLYPLLDEQAELDEDELEDYQEYLDLTGEIDCQNQKITQIKNEIKEACKKQCKNRKDKVNIRDMNFCLQQELRHLEFMQLRAIRLQNSGAARLYDGLVLSTSLDEDVSRSQNSWCTPMMEQVSTGQTGVLELKASSSSGCDE